VADGRQTAATVIAHRSLVFLHQPSSISLLMPRIKTTRTVTMALFCLRVYLFLMLLLILVKFLRIFG
jgi:hypothetical protein